MKLSMFTPTHRPQFIGETYRSLLAQTSDVEWEWVVVPNGGVKDSDLPAELLDDPRVKVIHSEAKGIGALKNFACHQCTGDVLVELDHDDFLATDAFSLLCKAFESEPSGFYYSDFVNFKENGRCETYGEKYGWRSYKCVVDGRRYTACSAFEPSARSICQIGTAPNHVRAWSRPAYHAVKGHDVGLHVADDHDLVCRTYISGAPFVHIPKPIYLYRRYAGNTFVAQNNDIRTLQRANMNKYLYKLIARECKTRGLRAVDVGRPAMCERGWESYDLVANDYAVKDSYGPGEAMCVRAFDVLQRIPPERIVGVVNDLYALLAPGGWLLTATPSVDDGEGVTGRGAFQDPSHRSHWSENNFWYFTDRQYASMVDDVEARFQLVRCWTGYPSDWHKQHKIPYVHADLCALKGQRQPGQCYI